MNYLDQIYDEYFSKVNDDNEDDFASDKYTKMSIFLMHSGDGSSGYIHNPSKGDEIVIIQDNEPLMINKIKEVVNEQIKEFKNGTRGSMYTIKLEKPVKVNNKTINYGFIETLNKAYSTKWKKRLWTIGHISIPKSK